MKSTTVLAIIAITTAIAAGVYSYMHRPNTEVHVCIGTLDVYPEFESSYVAARKVSVWLPDYYVKGEECDVVYMQDGQMLFDSTTTWNNQEWHIDETLSRLMERNTIRRTIVVAIDNTSQRLSEYSPYGTGDNYLKFIVEELKPFIDETYMPYTDRMHTFIMGSSMGGLISLYALCEYPSVFCGAACLSTHLSMEHLESQGNAQELADKFFLYVADHMPDPTVSYLYMDRGTKGVDSSYGPYQERMNGLFLDAGWSAGHFKYQLYDGHDHNETFWASRFEEPARFLLGRR